MKRAFAILSLFAIVSANLYQITLIGIYNIEKEYITKVFCVNKDKPELKCNGKCHLKKNLANAEEKQHDNKNTNNEIQIISPVFWEQTEIQMPQSSVAKTAYTGSKILMLKDAYRYTTLDPPRYS
ncbi:MAG: hypothetical protein KDE33_15245 [Bacteroidetes bacterium]|nr:hypothetical protein [Bacteroidota bacterium]MCB9226030.1 hypothetical protein [Chitinophagales bacterium]